MNYCYLLYDNNHRLLCAVFVPMSNNSKCGVNVSSEDTLHYLNIEK